MDSNFRSLNNFWDQEECDEKENTSFPKESSQDLLSLVKECEEELDFKLPAIYIQICEKQNGGLPKRRRLLGVADIISIYSIGKILLEINEVWLNEWEYPKIGIYFATTSSGGHDLFALDYRQCGRNGEPMVVHVNQEANYSITPVAKDLDSFLFEKLVPFPGDDDGTYEIVDKPDNIEPIIGEQRKFIYLENLKKKNFKFFEMKVEGKEIMIRFGRIGTKGQFYVKSFASHEIACYFFEKRVKDKQEVGYEEVKILYQRSNGKHHQHGTINLEVDDDEHSEENDENLLDGIRRSRDELKSCKISLRRLQNCIFIFILGAWLMFYLGIRLIYIFPWFFILLILYNIPFFHLLNI